MAITLQKADIIIEKSIEARHQLRLAPLTVAVLDAEDTWLHLKERINPHCYAHK